MKVPNLSQYKYFAIDTETTGLQYKKDKVFGISISTPDGQDFYWDTRNCRILEWLKAELPKCSGLVVMANASFDVRMLANSGVNLLDSRIDDVIVRASCIDEHLKSYSLDSLSKKYLNDNKVDTLVTDLAKLFGGRKTRNVQMPNLCRAPVDMVAPYAKQDTRLTLRLWEWQSREIARQGIQEICDFEKGLLPTFIQMEMRGIRIDENYTEEAINKLNPLVEKAQKEIDHSLGESVNVNSSPQVKRLFLNPKQQANGGWIAIDGTPLGKTATGNPSLGAETLREMTHPAAKMILDQRSLMKTRDTFLASHVLGSNIEGRVYPTINQSKKEDGGTGTGRLSIQNPAMQQIPSRNKEVAAIVKPCFLPNEGHVWVDADMASFEVRVFAHLVQDEGIMEAYVKNPELDFHQLVADMTGLVRNATYNGQPNAKQLNLSMIFNSGNGAIAEKMGMPWAWDEFSSRQDGKVIKYKKAGHKAMEIINAYHRRLPGIKRLATGAEARAKSRGYVFTKYGRHLRFPRGWRTYKASGLLIQATAADINKENISIITKALGNEGNLLLNVHDSYSMSMPEDTWKSKFAEIKQLIERPVLDVPLILEFSGKGHNWANALGL